MAAEDFSRLSGLFDHLLSRLPDRVQHILDSLGEGRGFGWLTGHSHQDMVADSLGGRSGVHLIADESAVAGAAEGGLVGMQAHGFAVAHFTLAHGEMLHIDPADYILG